MELVSAHSINTTSSTPISRRQGVFSSLKNIFFRSSATISPDSAISDGWEITNLRGDGSLKLLLDSWIETEDGQSNKGQRRLAREAIENFIENSDQTTLHLQDLDLVSLPDIFFHSAFTGRLKLINLAGNSISSIPSSLQHLQSLQKINGVSVAALSDIPQELTDNAGAFIIELSSVIPLRIETNSALTKASFLIGLHNWVAQDDGSNKKDKQVAIKKILDFIHDENSLSLDFSNLDLKSLPDDLFNHEAFSKRQYTLITKKNRSPIDSVQRAPIDHNAIQEGKKIRAIELEKKAILKAEDPIYALEHTREPSIKNDIEFLFDLLKQEQSPWIVERFFNAQAKDSADVMLKAIRIFDSPSISEFASPRLKNSKEFTSKRDAMFGIKTPTALESPPLKRTLCLEPMPEHSLSNEQKRDREFILTFLQESESPYILNFIDKTLLSDASFMLQVVEILGISALDYLDSDLIGNRAIQDFFEKNLGFNPFAEDPINIYASEILKF
jgi:hypothetical protein